MTDLRDRLLAILKEPGPYSTQESDLGWAAVDDTTIVHHISFCSNEVDAVKRAADLNASHRLKRLCEELRDFVICDIAIGFHNDGEQSKAVGAIKVGEAILALGEDNEHS